MRAHRLIEAGVRRLVNVLVLIGVVESDVYVHCKRCCREDYCPLPH